MIGLYFYVIAAAMAVLGVLFFYKTNIEKVKENPENAATAQRNFFLGVGMSEVIPIMLIIFAFVTTDAAFEMSNLMGPAILIVTLMAVSIFFIMMQRVIGVPEESRHAVNQLSMVAIAMANAVPLIAIIFLYLSIA